MKFIQKLGSRKFLVTIFGAIGVLSNQLFGLEIPKDVIESFIFLIVSFIGVQGVVDSISSFTKK